MFNMQGAQKLIGEGKPLSIIEWIKKNPKLAAAMGVGGAVAGAGGAELAHDSEDDEDQ